MAKQKSAADPTPPGVPPDGQPVAGGDDARTPPPFGTPVPAGEGALPRVVPQLARATPGTTRVKVRCRNYDPRNETLYVLVAAGKDPAKDAVAHYLAVTGIAAEVEALKAAGVKDVEAPLPVAVVLPD